MERRSTVRVGVQGVVCAVVAALAIGWPGSGARSQEAEPGELWEVPPAPQEFAAPEDDPAGRVAREIARRVLRFPNLRAFHAMGQWRHDRRAVWSIRPERECLAELAELGVESAPVHTRRGVPTPVAVRSAIGEVRYRKPNPSAPLIVSCELAVRMVHLSAVLRRHGIESVEVMSSWRTEPYTSFHTMGLALDIRALYADDGAVLDVARDFRMTAAQLTCPAPESADRLRRIACDLEATGRFSTVITPHYSEGHRDHFHVDVRPDDPRVFVR